MAGERSDAPRKKRLRATRLDQGLGLLGMTLTHWRRPINGTDYCINQWHIVLLASDRQARHPVHALRPHQGRLDTAASAYRLSSRPSPPSSARPTASSSIASTFSSVLPLPPGLLLIRSTSPTCTYQLKGDCMPQSAHTAMAK